MAEAEFQFQFQVQVQVHGRGRGRRLGSVRRSEPSIICNLNTRALMSRTNKNVCCREGVLDLDYVHNQSNVLQKTQT